MSLTDDDIERIADRVKDKFWIDAETHYQHHSVWRGFEPDDIHSLKDLIGAYRAARGLFWKAFLGFAVIGALVAAAVGMGFKH